ncbi:WD40 repeat [Lecanosticta acicola]|uniref:WD40 repeat n=1 Tax=Lecanosticta acicola TaxID=111012 RepID=A0AAI9EBN8_9PEZI|nr:WD40 repeat [Lecanosticta acicola]
MAQFVIDLTASDDENDAHEGSPRKNVLASFKPRKEKRNEKSKFNDRNSVGEVPITSEKERDTTQNLRQERARGDAVARKTDDEPAKKKMKIWHSYSPVPSRFSTPPLPASRGLERSTSEEPKGVMHTREGNKPTSGVPSGRPTGPNMHGLPYTLEEDQLLKRLKDVECLSWDQIGLYFNGRTLGSLQVRYSSKLSRLPMSDGSRQVLPRRKSERPSLPIADSTDGLDEPAGRPKRQRNSTAAVPDGFVSWRSLKKPNDANERPDIDTPLAFETLPSRDEELCPLSNKDLAFPSSMPRILRQRELGLTSRRAWTGSHATTEELQNHVFTDYTVRRQYEKMSGDVISLSWSPDGHRFAASAIAISDARSMQYNMSRNLLLGNERGELRELPEHHVPRPVIDQRDKDNVNGLHAMRASQDPRLFLTVAATAFSADGEKLFTAGTDKKMRQYRIEDDGGVQCQESVEHDTPVDLLAVHGSVSDLLAIGCHSASQNIKIYRSGKRADLLQLLSPFRSNVQSSVPIFPSALKWGAAPRHRNLLLAGFSGDQDKANAGETLLYDAANGTSLPMSGSTKNVFDVAWNPLASTASIAFVVACDPSGENVSRGMRSVVQCFAPDQGRARRILTWQCPAVDINDVAICPHDDNLIAAGATNGAVYIWDQRSADRSQQPLHILKHGVSENVLADDRDAELADTGVRFLSWGATKSRLYTGSSDGVVKVWNPYRSGSNAHVDDLVIPSRQRSAVMSGAFSPDYRELLVGTENGRIDLFSIGGEVGYRTKPFNLVESTASAEKAESDPFSAAQSLLESGQIEVKPCGAMPFRQAVQGPSYAGPYLKPSSEEYTKAEKIYQLALDEKANADKETDEKRKSKAGKKVYEAQMALSELQERHDHHEFSSAKAEKLQEQMARAEQRRRELVKRLPYPAEPCQLDCAVLPTDEEPEDSARSEMRIPGMLRSVAQLALQAEDEESSNTCASCSPRNALIARAKGKKTTVCASCSLKKARLTSVCERCSGPARLQTDNVRGSTLCEDCSFKCFRCARIVEVDPGLAHLRCYSCDLTWEAGVLGYELLTRGRAPWRRSTIDEELDEEELGNAEREHYASLWQDKEPGMA